ncbi:MAG TPA: hypothetical protein VHB21_07020 [Minicystis sp.]|nr:hypothetical protein [Minicystis sp.]
MTAHLVLGDALAQYAAWPTPTVIVSDGAYGVAGFPGDPPNASELVDWYAPHVGAWAARASPSTTLWFWDTEIGWATVHPLLERHGFTYRACHVWDKERSRRSARPAVLRDRRRAPDDGRGLGEAPREVPLRGRRHERVA